MKKIKMKKTNLLIIAIGALSICFTSCLKETSHPPLYGWNSPNVISFQDNGGVTGGGAGYGSTTTPYPSYNFSFALQNDTAGFDAIVMYGPKGPAPQDITVNVAVDTAALNAFNDANSTSYVAPDNSTYSFPSSVVIRKGQSQAYVHVTIKASPSFDFNASYALPLSITSATAATVSTNMGSEINIFKVQNQYEGNYTATGYLYHPSSPRAISKQKYLSTAGANSVEVELGDLGGSGYDAIFTIDPVTNKVTITAAPGAGGAPYTMFTSGLPTTNPGYTPAWSGSAQCNNTYDPATKTFYVRYGYMGGSGWRVTEEIIKKN